MPLPLFHRFRLVAQITRGLFLTDSKRSVWGRFWQLFSRFTWELPQTLVGWLYSIGRALLGRADRVDTFGGITFHTIDSQRFGWAYLFIIGLPSLLSAMGKGNHNVFWTETRANRHAKRYFGKHYSIAWNEAGYPTKHFA